MIGRQEAWICIETIDENPTTVPEYSSIIRGLGASQVAWVLVMVLIDRARLGSC